MAGSTQSIARTSSQPNQVAPNASSPLDRCADDGFIVENLEQRIAVGQHIAYVLAHNGTMSLAPSYGAEELYDG